MPVRILGSVLLALCLTTPARAGDPTIVDHYNPRKHLVCDQRLIASADGLKLVQGTVTKEGKNPLFQADQPWENALNNLYPNVAYDRQDGLFKLWYKCVLTDKEIIAKMMPPATVHDQGWFLLYATSKDGHAWEKPSLGQIGFDGKQANNAAARDTPNAGVLFDRNESDPTKRFKMIYDVGPGEMRVRFSSDGVRWGEPITPQGLGKVGDTHNNAFFDPVAKEYILLTRMYLGERLVYASRSKDFLNWSEPKLALRSTPEEAKARQTYCLTGFPYGNGYVGMVMMYNATTDRTVSCELAYSEDGTGWRRLFPGTPFIPRGEAGSYDAGCIYAQSNAPAMLQGKLQIYYGGSTAVHRGWKRHCLPCLATLPADRFAGYAPAKPDTDGTLITRPVKVTAEGLRLSADAKGGWITVSALDDTGKPLLDSEPIKADATESSVPWANDAIWKTLEGRTLTLRITIHNATAYSITGVNLLPAGVR